MGGQEVLGPSLVGIEVTVLKCTRVPFLISPKKGMAGDQMALHVVETWTGRPPASVIFLEAVQNIRVFCTFPPNM